MGVQLLGVRLPLNSDKIMPESMKIFGLDFTSVPSSRKPITSAQCNLSADILKLEKFETFESFDAFEVFLTQPGPWVAGLDFPFEQPRRLIENIGWPKSCEAYVRMLSRISKDEFVRMLAEYRKNRPPGDKQHLRRVDELASSRSPMMLFGVPGGKMFFAGSHRLLNSGACILPCHPNADPRIVVEAYPALVARRWIEYCGYKNDDRRKQTSAQRYGRAEIMRGLQANAKARFGFDMGFSSDWAHKFTQDATGDKLDAFLCAVQAGWAYSRLDEGYGIPAECDPLEGWIVDPGLLN